MAIHVVEIGYHRGVILKYLLGKATYCALTCGTFELSAISQVLEATTDDLTPTLSNIM